MKFKKKNSFIEVLPNTELNKLLIYGLTLHRTLNEKNHKTHDHNLSNMKSKRWLSLKSHLTSVSEIIRNGNFILNWVEEMYLFRVVWLGWVMS